MEVLDGNGDLITWLSDDPDDWNSYSDYENRIRRMVLELNEELFSAGCHLLLTLLSYSEASIPIILLTLTYKRNFVKSGDGQTIVFPVVTRIMKTDSFKKYK